MLLDGISTVLFDLDSTLLPMNENNFRDLYFQALAVKCEPLGYKPEDIINGIKAGRVAMYKNDGTQTNETVFWKAFSQVLGEEVLKHRDVFDDFYRNDFVAAKPSCGFNPLADKTVKLVKSMGKRAAMATNPIFPRVATENRALWAGLDLDDFELLTAYENSGYCKPNLKYYIDVCERLGVKPEDCLMVGNDVTEDMCAESLGMKVFLITDCLINTDMLDYSSYPQGNFEDLIRLIKEG